METHTIDATNQSLGRIATKVALLLRGKQRVTFQPNVMPQEKVIVTNITKMKFTGSKLTTKAYHRYSGYPGGIHTRMLGQLMESDPKKVFWKAVYNMLPENRLRSRIMKNLELHA